MRSRFLLGGGCVLTLGAKSSNFSRADVLIDGGVIAEVGEGLRARDAEVVDATDTIVMPGFVDTHRHLTRSLFRNAGSGASGDPIRADDVYAATLIGLLGAVEAGITTVVDWFDHAPDEGVAEAALQAHADSGIRTVFVLATREGAEVDPQSPRERAPRLSAATGPSTAIAFGSPMGRDAVLDRLADDWGWARATGMRVHAHLSPGPSGGAGIAAVGERGLLDADVTLIHCPRLDDADVAAIASAGASVSLAPASEMASGSGPSPIQQLIAREVRPGLAVEDERLSPGDLFAQMRAAISLQHATVFDLKLAGKAGLPHLMSTRDVIRLATADGAKAVGLGEATGSLEPGKRADVVVLRADRPNIFPINDPIGAVVWGMDTSNVDWVFADGSVLMREGALTADVGRARALALTAVRRVAGAAGPLAGVARGGEG